MGGKLNCGKKKTTPLSVLFFLLCRKLSKKFKYLVFVCHAFGKEEAFNKTLLCALLDESKQTAEHLRINSRLYKDEMVTDCVLKHV